ncbi:MAG TPA: bifunctional histidinol-phosphatase/imidazoleglycerol-phosphate dehydratase HisB [Steroidobacteraceae bacterium]
MSDRRVIFLDRNGTLNEAAADEPVDSVAKVRLMPDVVPSLLELKRAGFAFVIVVNQDGLGAAGLPREAFGQAHRFILDLFASQGIEFEAVLIGMLREWLGAGDIDKQRSFMIGARDTDLEFAKNLGIEGLRIRLCDSGQQSWPGITRHILSQGRRSHVQRLTKETDISAEVDLSRAGPISVATGLGFFDHMLEQIAKHGGFSLKLTCKGDLHIDEHHTIEDCALALGAALREALGEKRGIARYGFLLAMDEAEAQVVLDLSGRPFFVWEGKFNRERVGELPTELVPHFFRSLAESLGAALHLKVRGENTHHMIESCFKGVGRSLRQAIRLEGEELPSTKGIL